MLRPWKAPSAATMPVRPVRRASLMAASSASVPELQKKTAEPVGRVRRASSSRSASSTCGIEVKKFDTCTSWPACLETAATSAGWLWPERVDRDAADEVEVAAAVDVPDPGAVAVLEHELRAAEEVEQRALVAARATRSWRAGVGAGPSVARVTIVGLLVGQRPSCRCPRT